MSCRFTVVGCGTVVPEAATGGSCFVVDSDQDLVLLDCGPGAVRSLVTLEIEWSAVSHILLTHFHTDHVGGLPGLLFSLTHGLLPERRREPLSVIGPPGTRSVLEHLARALGDYVLDPGFPLEVTELQPGRPHSMSSSLDVRSLSTPHTEESLAFRLEAPGASVVYSGDTGPAVELGSFAAESDLFVCECSLPDGLVGDNHLSPQAVARFAAEARPATLLLTHVYPQFRSAADVPALVRAAGFDGRIELAREGWSRDLGSPTAPLEG